MSKRQGPLRSWWNRRQEEVAREGTATLVSCGERLSEALKESVCAQDGTYAQTCPHAPPQTLLCTQGTPCAPAELLGCGGSTGGKHEHTTHRRDGGEKGRDFAQQCKAGRRWHTGCLLLCHSMQMYTRTTQSRTIRPLPVSTKFKNWLPPGEAAVPDPPSPVQQQRADAEQPPPH